MVNRSRTKAIIAGLVALAVIASACGSSSDEADASDGRAAETTYLDAIESITTEADSTIREAFDTAFAQGEERAFETLLPEFSAALGTAISVQEDAIDQYEALDPPSAFAADHARNIEFLQELNDASARQQTAADAGDTELIAQIDLELGSLSREFLAIVSPEFAQRIGTSENGAAATQLFVGLEADETDYLDAVATGWEEFNRRNRSFSEALSQSYGNDQLLLDALLRAGAGEAFAAARAVIIEIDPPASYADGHARLLSYLDETVALDTVIGEAAENGDVVAFEVANYGLGLAGARFALEAPPSLAAVIAEPADLVPPEGLPGDAFGEELWQALQRFRVLAFRTQGSTGVFPIISDENLAAATATITPTVIDLTDETVAEIEALNPPAELQPGNDRVLTYLHDLVALRESVLDAATTGDLDRLRTYGELGGFAAERAETELWCSARADLTDNTIEPITATFFREFEGLTLAQLCPEA